MAMVYVCTGCGDEYDEEPNLYCDTCQSYKYFGWVEDEEF